ncbi:hypothetical protein V8F33_000605 [Rhypophila sp. PSN 637]
MIRSALKPTAPRFDHLSAEQDFRRDSSTGLSSNQFSSIGDRWARDRAAALKGVPRGRPESPDPSRRIHFVHVPAPSRPRSATRTSYSDEASWGVLFDSRGRETERMEHILKKLGGYIRNNWAPYDTRVITPDKMFKFYSCYYIETERLPFRELFSSKTSNKRIAAVYDHLGVDYIQYDGRHSTPGLTRLGFAQFLIKTIRAFPDEEHRRLQRVIQAIPFDIDDNTNGGGYVRVPRSLPRHYLPKGPGMDSYQRLLYDAVKRAISSPGSSSSSSSSSDSSSGKSSSRKDKEKNKKKQHRRQSILVNSPPSPSSTNMMKPKKKVTIITPPSSPPPPPPLIRNPPPIAATTGNYYASPKDLYDMNHQQQQQQQQQAYQPGNNYDDYHLNSSSMPTRKISSPLTTYYDDDDEMYNNRDTIDRETKRNTDINSLYQDHHHMHPRGVVGNMPRYASRPV